MRKRIPSAPYQLILFKPAGRWISAGLFLLAALVSSAIAFAAAQSDYIRNVEGLLNSVPSNDPTRTQLTLKLADAYFNESLSLSTQAQVSRADQSQIERYRKQSAKLYQEALSGLGGAFPAPSGESRAKIQFQLARLYSDLGNLPGAQKTWTELASFEANSDIQRESLLRLAESLENEGKSEGIRRAEDYFKKALKLCSTQDVCSYCHYRLAWLYERQNQLDQAVSEMKEALWDGRGQVREESLRDYINFLAARPDDGKASLVAVEELGQKIKRDELQKDLVEAYFAAGNKKAGVYVLQHVNRRFPSLKGYARLLEEQYGLRNWDSFDAEMDSSMAFVGETKTPQAFEPEAEKILKRLTVQLDGERISQPNRAAHFKKAVLLYLLAYPRQKDRPHMVDGWLAAESDDGAKLKQLAVWIEEEKQAGNLLEEKRLREMRAATAQKTKDYPVLIVELDALEKLAKTPTEKRERSYQIAYAFYQNKDFAKALPIFQKLSTIPTNTDEKIDDKPDKWAIQSENLALDILGQQKAYSEVVKQAQLWTRDKRFESWIAALPAHANDLRDLKKVELSAEFEWANSLGEKAEALEVYHRNCQQGILLPQSCDNAQILAVKLGHQPILIATLKKLGKRSELAAELEASGAFLEAAAILEKDSPLPNSATKNLLKVALLYELGGDNTNRDRMLRGLVQKLARAASLGAEEDLILQTLTEAELLHPNMLALAWKKSNREKLVGLLEANNKGNAESHKLLAASCTDLGPAWQKMALAELRRLDEQQRKIHFTGKNSKQRFQARVSALKQLVDRGGCYLSETTPSNRVIFATLLERSQQVLAQEIVTSPIPEGLDEEGKKSIEQALSQMAQPFLDKAKSFADLASTQLDKIEDGVKRENLKKARAASDDSIFNLTEPQAGATAKMAAQTPNESMFKAALQELQKNANSRSSLENLKGYYEAAGKTRLAAYFQGRLLQLGAGGKQ